MMPPQHFAMQTCSVTSTMWQAGWLTSYQHSAPGTCVCCRARPESGNLIMASHCWREMGFTAQNQDHRQGASAGFMLQPQLLHRISMQLLRIREGFCANVSCVGQPMQPSEHVSSL